VGRGKDLGGMKKRQTGRQRSEERRTIVISDLSVCHYCKLKDLSDKSTTCPNCGFPQRGSQVEMKRFIWNINNKHILLAQHKKAIEQARNILFGLFALFTGLALLSLIFKVNIIEFSVFLLVGTIYLGLGLLSKHKPFVSILSGFILFFVALIVHGVIDSEAIFKALFMKGVVIAGFYYGYKGVSSAESIEDELELIKNAKEINTTEESIKDN